MKNLNRDQILEIAKRWDYVLGRTQKDHAASIKEVSDKICDDGQSVSIAYCTKLFKIFRKCRDGFQYRTTKAYLDTLSDLDIAKGNFPYFDSAEFHERATSIPNIIYHKPRKIEQSLDIESPYLISVKAENNRQFAKDVGCIAFVIIMVSAFAVHLFNNGWSIDDRSTEERALDQACTGRGQSGCSDAARDLESGN